MAKATYEKNPLTVAQIDKEFVRQWMLANKVNGEVPLTLIPEIIQETSQRYEEIYQLVTGTSLEINKNKILERLRGNLTQQELLIPNNSLHIS